MLFISIKRAPVCKVLIMVFMKLLQEYCECDDRSTTGKVVVWKGAILVRAQFSCWICVWPESFRSLDLSLFICKMGPWDLIPVLSFPINLSWVSLRSYLESIFSAHAYNRYFQLLCFHFVCVWVCVCVSASERESEIKIDLKKQSKLWELSRDWLKEGLACLLAKSLELCPTPSDPMDCSPPGSSVHGIFQATVLEWGAIAFSKKKVYYH